MKLLRFGLLTATFVLATFSRAQEEDVINPFLQPIPVVQTVALKTLTGSTGGFPPNWNLVRALPGSTVRLELSNDFPNATDIIWWRDSTEIARTGDVPYLELQNFRPLNHPSGQYWASFQLDGHREQSGPKRLLATDFSAGSLLNLSTRARLSPSTPELTVGFVVSEEGLAPGGGRYVLIRAIGPTLANYGVDSPIPDPVMKVWSVSSSSEIGIAFTEIAYEDGTTPFSRHYDHIRRINPVIGAFPIDLPTLENPTSSEEAMLIGLKAGAYTVTITSASGTEGDALVEVFEISEGIYTATMGDPPIIGVPPDIIVVEPSS